VSSATSTVNLVVLPYNYPGLWSLLDELASPTFKMIPSPRWRQEFERYLGTVPPYYLPYLRNGAIADLLFSFPR
jgi:integrator complex subunit 6